MNTTPITNDYFLSNAKKEVKRTGNSTLGKDDFLKILVKQLQHQDPTNPVEDKEFISQMAQFSTLEQMQNMTKAMEELLESQRENQLMNYTTFIGQEVKWHELLEEFDEEGNPVIQQGKGVIKELKFDNGMPIFVLDDGKEISTGNISSVLGKPQTNLAVNPLVEASMSIGKKIQYKGANDEWIESVIQAVTTNNQLTEYILENGERLTKNQFQWID